MASALAAASSKAVACLAPVAHDAEVEHVEPEARHHAVDAVAVAVVDLALASASPIAHSSSPVEKIATRDAPDLDLPTPTDATSPRCAGLRSVPAATPRLLHGCLAGLAPVLAGPVPGRDYGGRRRRAPAPA